MPFGLSTPSPLMKAEASARVKRVAIFSASQPFDVKGAVIQQALADAFGIAASSCSLIEMRSITGVAVSVVAAASVAQPEPTSDRSTITSNEVASTCTTLAIDRSDEVDKQHRLDALRVCGSTR
jgi:hypothetical protein